MQVRQTHIDVLKILGSQLIVFHHGSAYGPVADAVSGALPDLMRWLYDYARMAVQIFLVLGGYLAARSLEAVLHPTAEFPARILLRRYLRLAVPFLVALLLAMATAALARQWLDAGFIPAAPTWEQFGAHALLLHGVLGADALSAGVWYVAIDFQLFVLMALLLWLGRGSVRLARGGVLGLMLVSLFVFNRDTDWDNWAPYFFGAYGLGAAALWAGRSRWPGWMLALLLLTGVLALTVEFRTRIALALGVALWLGCAQWSTVPGFVLPQWLVPPVRALGRSSYALFLVHFPVLLLANALYVRLGLQGPVAGCVLLLLGWIVSMSLAMAFEKWVERPLTRR